MLGKTDHRTNLRLEVKEKESLSKKPRNLVLMLDLLQKVKDENLHFFTLKNKFFTNQCLTWFVQNFNLLKKNCLKVIRFILLATR